ncbi:HisA/HisF-related TIM barrel protein [Chthonobacter rhizosphaerae]|uniref:HisA/HisF-related TIM barrel protein n=1 Tax=Chthonobacter rhizosphaerae TaxID=2735553 RepID=UPI0031B603C2
MAMRVIPVIDLKDGVVVRARAGDRASYRPIVSPLCRSASASDVVDGLFGVHPFEALYIADLDAIEGRGGNRPLAAALLKARPGLEIWLDEGAADAAMAAGAAAMGVRPVIGSESQTGPETLAAAGPDAVLSLDFRDGFVGPEAILTTPSAWPRDVIVMTLARVGTDGGPDEARLSAVREAAGPGRRVFAAGGVRGEDDLVRLKAAGIAGALVATALHDGRLDGAALARLAGA